MLSHRCPVCLSVTLVYCGQTVASHHNVTRQERGEPRCGAVGVWLMPPPCRCVCGWKVCSDVNTIRRRRRPTIAARPAPRRRLGSKTFYPPEARAASANLCPFATNARRRSMLWSKVASISCLAPTVFHGGRRVPYGRAVMASPPRIVNACVH